MEQQPSVLLSHLSTFLCKTVIMSHQSITSPQQQQHQQQPPQNDHSLPSTLNSAGVVGGGGGGTHGITTATASTTTTLTETTATPTEVLRLTLRPRPNVTWDQTVVDNEGMGRKSSKRCCIFHKQRDFGESSTDSSDQDSDHENSKKKIAHKKKTPDHLRFHA
jgi:protein phosphatase 1 regulatory subunit 11